MKNDLKKKKDLEVKKSKKIFFYFEDLIADEELDKKIEAKQREKFSFQSNEALNDKNNKTFILSRVKYCINTIIKHLNELSRTNFFDDEKESTENFVKGLNKMISLEGSSEMLKDNGLPLEWFGLYLQSNIENIPPEYKDNNYSKLYNELPLVKTNLSKLRLPNNTLVYSSFSFFVGSP